MVSANLGGGDAPPCGWDVHIFPAGNTPDKSLASCGQCKDFALVCWINDGIACPSTAETAVSILGPDLGTGQRPQLIVPSNAWQKSVPENGWVLVGCTVSPGFEFERFELAPKGWEQEHRPQNIAKIP